jgi:predicted nucleic acid-binding protein
VILADTSVWVDHLRAGDRELAHALEASRVVVHPFIVGEIACGNLRNRREVLDLFGKLPALPVASHEEAVEFIERRRLMGRGIGYVDVHLLASVLLEPPVRIWTRDRRLARVAGELGVRHAPS